jgi:hypothetical protein
MQDALSDLPRAPPFGQPGPASYRKNPLSRILAGTALPDIEMKAGKVLQIPEVNVVIFSFLLNLAWEMWQVPFFLGMADAPHWQGVKACTQATAGDAGIALAAFWITAVAARNRHWMFAPRKSDLAAFIGTGLIATIVFEALATEVLGRWTYTEAMPRLPIIGTGLLPLLQWLVIPPLVLWFVRRQINCK